jgi:glutathione peroxidase
VSIHDFTVSTADGGSLELREYAGQVLLIVNVASRCGFTPQYEGLEALHRAERDRGLRVLGFPCNQFGDQEPGTAEEIAAFCSTTYDVTFPVLSKVEVNGPDAHPLFAYLREQAPGDFGPQYGRLYDYLAAQRPESIGTDEIKWNFTKFLVDREGAVVRRFEPTVTADDLRPELERVLA